MQQTQSSNERWGAKFVQKQSVFDKYRTLLPIINEIALAEKLAHEPSIIAMAFHENDPKIRLEGLKTLEHYRTQFQDRSYFVAFSQSYNYYFSDRSNKYPKDRPLYKVSLHEPRDGWFFQTISMGEPFQINIDKDRFLGVTKVWINYVIRDNGKAVGVIGTGFDFDQFLKNSIGFEQAGGANYFIKKDLSIQLAKDTRMIDYRSINKPDGSHKRIDMLISDPADIKRMQEAMRELENSKNSNAVKTLWVNIKDEKYLLGIAYAREVGWFNLALFNKNELTLVDNKNLFIVMSILFLIAMAVLGFRLKQGVVSPIEKLMDHMDSVKKGENNENLFLAGSCEIAELSDRFNGLVHEIKEHNATLEQKIQERTEALVASEVKLQSLAFYDTLTNLPNRRLLGDRLTQAQSLSKRNNCYGAVLFMDLDNFKPLNDTHGHTIGDLLLIQVAQRIRSSVRESDTVARFGGDEFIVLLSELDEDKDASIAQAQLIAEKIRQTLDHPYFLKIPSDTIEEKIVEHRCTASIGLTLFFDHEQTQDEIFNQADSAMYEAKEHGRNKILVYQKENR